MTVESPAELRERLAREHQARIIEQESHTRNIAGDDVMVRGRAILQHLQDGEPFFVLRAQDILSSFAIDEYSRLVEKFSPMSEQSDSLIQALNAFRTWQRNNPGKVKLPD